MRRNSYLACLSALVLWWTGTNAASAQDWKPTHNVEIDSTAAAGGLNDLVARTLQDVWKSAGTLGVSTTVVNRPGGGGVVALNYLLQHPGDGHYIVPHAAAIMSNKIVGDTNLTYTDFTTLGILFTEYEGVVVKKDSPIKDIHDLVNRLKADPTSVRFALATALGNEVHTGLSIPLNMSGVDIKRMRIAVFNSSPEVISSLLGDHVDAIAISPGSIVGQIQAGTVRMLAVTAPSRLGGPFAQVPTWKESGVDMTFEAPYVVVGPPKLDPSVKQFWGNALRVATQQPAWRDRLTQQNWNDHFMGPDDAKATLDKEYPVFEATLKQLGLAKN